MNRLLVVALFALTAGCGGLFELTVPLRSSTPPRTASAGPTATAPAAAAAPSTVDVAAQEEARRRHAEEAAQRQQAEEAARQERQAKAKIPQKLRVAELGIDITVPGDVTYKPHTSTAYGDPALILTGPVSYFALIVTDASSDRYGLQDRISKQRGAFTYGIDVVRQKQHRDGSWEFEYTTPTYYTDGTRSGTDMGVFARRVVGGKKYNCLIAGLSSQEDLDAAVNACQSMKPAR